MLFGAKWADSKSLGKIPSSDAAIFDRCKKDAGFVPFYIRKMEHPAARKAFAFAFILRMNQGSEEVPAALKQVYDCRCPIVVGCNCIYCYDNILNTFRLKIACCGDNRSFVRSTRSSTSWVVYWFNPQKNSGAILPSKQKPSSDPPPQKKTIQESMTVKEAQSISSPKQTRQPINTSTMVFGQWYEICVYDPHYHFLLLFFKDHTHRMIFV